MIHAFYISDNFDGNVDSWHGNHIDTDVCMVRCGLWFQLPRMVWHVVSPSILCDYDIHANES